MAFLYMTSCVVQSTLCNLRRLPSKTTSSIFLWKAVTLLIHAAVHLVESQALSRMAAISSSGNVATRSSGIQTWLYSEHVVKGPNLKIVG